MIKRISLLVVLFWAICFNVIAENRTAVLGKDFAIENLSSYGSDLTISSSDTDVAVVLPDNVIKPLTLGSSEIKVTDQRGLNVLTFTLKVIYEFENEGDDVDVTLTEAGTLEAKVLATGTTAVRKLTVHGPITAADVQFIRRHAGVLSNLEWVNLKDITIVPNETEPYCNYRGDDGDVMWSGYYYYYYFSERDEVKYAGSISLGNGGSVGYYKMDFSGLFYGCDWLRMAELPGSLKSIGDYTFQGCEKLLQLPDFPTSIQSIGESAFWGCQSLLSIPLTKTLTTIKEKAFSYCKSLLSLNLCNVVDIPYKLCDGCESLRSVEFSDKLSTIGDWAFSETQLASAAIPSSVNRVGEGAFNRTPLAAKGYDETIGGVQYLGCVAMRFNDNVSDIVFREGTTVIADEPRIGAHLTSVKFPASLRRIGDWAFSYSKLSSVTIPNSVTSIGVHAFYHCAGLTDLTFSDSDGDPVTEIGYSAFAGCTGLTNVTISNTVTEIGSYAFSGCTGLTNITIPNSVTEIGNSAFSDCTGLTSVTLPTSLEQIGNLAFSGSGIRSITIPENVKKMDPDVFKNCKNLVSCDFNAQNVEGGVYPFRGSGLTKLNIGPKVNYIPESFAYAAASLRIVSFARRACPTDTLTIGDGAFRSASLFQFSLPDAPLKIDSSAFESFKSEQTFEANNVVSVDIKAFLNCVGLTSVTFGNGEITMGWAAFSGCTSLTSVTFRESSVAAISNEAFKGCTGLKSVTIGDGVTSINWRAFINDNALENFYAFPRCADIAMGNNVFSGASTSSCTLHVRPSQLDAYKTADQWKDFFNIVGDLDDPDYNPLDVNGDGSVNVGEVNDVLAEILAHPDGDGNSKYDVSGDGAVNVGDVNLILAYILEHPDE